MLSGRSLAVFASLALSAHCIPQADAADPPKLPGARATIDAAQYPSLQAALDAIPKEGGIVKLPPGTFELTEPLLLTKGDVLIVGSGPATHLHNANTDGQPAIVLQHPEGTRTPRDQRL